MPRKIDQASGTPVCASGYHYLIVFQNGPRVENGINGCLMEDIIRDVLIPRLDGYQKGDFPCAENATALSHLHSALQALDDRTAKRRAQGVEGKNAEHKS